MNFLKPNWRLFFHMLEACPENISIHDGIADTDKYAYYSAVGMTSVRFKDHVHSFPES